MRVEVAPPDPAWKEKFETESRQIVRVIEDNVVAIHHIGSTAISGIYAKPIIDVLIEVKDISKTDAQTASMGAIGYEAMDEFGIWVAATFARTVHPILELTMFILIN